MILEFIFYILLVLIKRITLIKKLSERKEENFKRKWGHSIKIHSVTLRALNVIELSGVTIDNENAQISIDYITVEIDFFFVVKKRKIIRKITLGTLDLRTHGSSEVGNRSHVKGKNNQILFERYQRLGLKLIRLYILTQNNIEKWCFNRFILSNETYEISATLAKIKFDEIAFVFHVNLIYKSHCEDLVLDGECIKGIHGNYWVTSIMLKNQEATTLSPLNRYFIDRKFVVKSKLDDITSSKEPIVLYFKSFYNNKTFNQFTLKHDGFIDFRCNLTLNASELSSSGSLLKINGIPIKVKFDNLFNKRRTSLFLGIGRTPIQKILQLFSDFKAGGRFYNSYSGAIKMELHSIINFQKRPFVTTKYRLKHNIRRKNRSYFDFIEGDFKHTVKDSCSCDSSKEIQISTSNKDFISIQSIPKIIPAIIVFFEDRNFFLHKGVDFNTLVNALLVNIGNQKFIIGGSTITMQIVKNLLLNQNRLISRKIEEITIAFLLENVYEISKNRLFSIYINIIEFGPGIYGILEASLYYFSKMPSLLSLFELLTIIYIIPRPLFFHDALLANSPVLSANLKNHIRKAIPLLLKNKIITSSDLKDENKVCFSSTVGSLMIYI